MNNFELIQQLIRRLKKFSWLIILIALTFGGLFYYMARQGLVIFTSTATVFPLNGTQDNSVSSSAISSILGLADAPKSFTSDASINIVELATSRRTREAVAMAKIPSLGNKTVAELLIEEYNKHTGFMQNEPIQLPLDSLGMMNTASNILKGGFSARIGKNGILELHFSNTSQKLVREISYIYIEKLAAFYIDLKKKKAQIDFEFAVMKVDSLAKVLAMLDRRAIQLDESTFFTNEQLKRYSIPKINLEQDKATVQSQYYYAVNNRESAAYRLQKETPIIEPLDRPEPPYDVQMKSKTMYIAIGLILGTLIGVILVSIKIINKYIGAELNKAIEKAAAKAKQQGLQEQEEPIK